MQHAFNYGQLRRQGPASYLCCTFRAAADPAFSLDAVLPDPVLLQPLEVPEASLLQDLQTRAQSVLLLLEILQTLNLRWEEHGSIRFT